MKGNFNFVFQRYETKYLLTEEKYHLMRKMLEPHMQVDQYGLSTICNIYYDTPDFRLIRASLDKPAYKEKFRVRSYGIPKSESNVFLEIKKKYNGIVYKRREVMSHAQSLEYLQNRVKPYDTQILREIDYFFDFYVLNPAVFLAYDRIAMFGIEDPDLRITFDANIRSRFDELNLASGDRGELLLRGDEKYLLETKIYQAMPIWLANILSELELFPTSFSKYGRVYEDMVKQNISFSDKEIYTYV